MGLSSQWNLGKNMHWMGPGPSETSESQIAGDTSPEQGCMARWNYEQARDDNDIPGRDPAVPLAPLGGTESLLHSPPPPNGNVRVPKTFQRISYEVSQTST